MLIDYSIRSFELLERKLELNEKEEIFDVFSRLGTVSYTHLDVYKRQAQGTRC